MAKKIIIGIFLIAFILFLLYFGRYFVYKIFFQYKTQDWLDFDYLNNKKIENPLNIGVIKIFSKDFYVGVIKAVDINNDGKTEIIFKKDKDLYILDNDWNEKSHCFAGNSVNLVEVLLIDDINHDNKPEILTTGGKDSIYDELLRKYDLGGGVWYENGYKRIELDSRSGIVDPMFFTEIKKEANDAEKMDDSNYKIPDASWEKIDTENYSLKIFDINCNLLSEHIISNNRQTPNYLVSEKIGDENAVVYEAWGVRKNTKYILQNNKFNLLDDNNAINKIDEKSEENKFPIDKSKMIRMRIGGKIFVDDLNGDGKKEIIVFAHPLVSYNVDTTIFIFDFESEKLIWKYKTDPSLAQEIADINNDGKKEIISAGTYIDPITVFGFR